MPRISSRSFISLFLVYCFGFVSTVPLSAQEDDKSTDELTTEEVNSDLPIGHSQHGEAFNEGPRQKAYLMGGTGNVTFPVTSDHPEVQKFVEQGIGQLHGYWYFEAERSFRQAAMFDPDCAITYWGMALANTGNSKRAKEFIAEAVKRKEKASERERMYIDAAKNYVTVDKKAKGRGKKYIEALAEIVKKYPDDIEAKAFHCYALYKHKRDVKKDHAAVDKVIKELFAIAPHHPVHHYRIHLWDYKEPGKVIDSSALCGPAAPRIAHMWHMPGHIYSRLKRYEDAVWQQEASARVDHANMMRDGVMPDQIHNFAHNNEWLIRNLEYIGKWQAGVALAKNMIELPQHPKYNTLSKRGSAYYGRLRLFNTLARFELWDEMITACNGPHLTPTDSDAEQVKRLRYLGIAYVETGQIDKARTTIDELKHRKIELEEVPEQVEKKSNEQKSDEKEPDEQEKTKPDEQSKELTDDDKKELEKKKKEAAAAAKKKADDAKRKRDSAKRSIDMAIAAIETYIAIRDADFETAVKRARTARLNSLLQAKLQVLAGHHEAAIKAAEKAMKNQTNRTVPLATYIEILWAAGKKEQAKDEFKKLRSISGSIQFGTPVFDRLAPIAKELGFPEDWRYTGFVADDLGDRPDLNTLGPFRWQPSTAPDWTRNDHLGKPHSLKDYAGKPVIVIFYLGHGCLHCAEQLQAFAPKTKEFNKAGIELIAVSSDDRQYLKNSVDVYEGGMPFPLVSDGRLELFRQYRAYDDFEEMALHGTYLIDADGKIRWQDISYEPFMEPDFLLAEAKRLLAQPKSSNDESFAQAETLPPRPEGLGIITSSEPEPTRRELQRIIPAGIDGSLIVAGKNVPEKAINTFFDLAKGKQANVAILRLDNHQMSRGLTARLVEQWDIKEAKTIEIIKLKADEQLSEKEQSRLNEATGLWLISEEEGKLKSALMKSELQQVLTKLAQRKGPLAIAGAGAKHLAQFIVNNDDKLMASKFSLLPDAVINVTNTDEDSESPLHEALKKDPTLIGYEIDPDAALVIRGRRIISIGEGTVGIHLAKTKTQPAKQITLSEKNRFADLTALRRTVRLRFDGTFPPRKPGPPEVQDGTLILIGGGRMPKGMEAKFLKLAGGKDAEIVILPTAMPDPVPSRSHSAEVFRAAGAKKVTVLPERTLDKVESEEYINVLKTATGIWFGGGRQWRFVDAYLDTKAHDLMHDVLNRGGVIMGSSAGASIQAEYLARGNPLGNLDIMAEGYEQGLGFLKGVAVDQHFSQRNRLKDMSSLVKRYPQFLGIGIDEDTAIIVTKNVATVAGGNRALFYDAKRKVEKDEPDYEAVGHGGRYDLVDRRVLNAGEQPDSEKMESKEARPEGTVARPAA